MQFVQTKSIGSTPMLYGADSFLILSVTTVFSYFFTGLNSSGGLKFPRLYLELNVPLFIPSSSAH